MENKRPSSLKNILRRIMMIGMLFVSFTFGYGVVSDGRNMVCQAASAITAPTVTIITSFCAISCNPYTSTTVTCEMTGTGSQVSNIILNPYKEQLKQQAKQLDKWIGNAADGFTESVLKTIDVMETDMISWWDTMWAYNLRPGLQAMTTQIATATVQQTSEMSEAADVNAVAAAQQATDAQDVKDKRTTATDDNGCAVATVSGGLGRATGFSKAMRKGFQNRGLDSGSNRRGSKAAGGRALELRARSDTYESTFCDPTDNAGENLCGTTAKPEFYNADTKVTEILYNKLTIPVTDPNYQAATESIIENIAGDPSADPVDSTTLRKPEGQQIWNNRRAFMARYAAVGSVPRMIAGWKMPGAGPNMAQWVNELRKGTGPVPLIPDVELSANPSYREVMHAITIDRFNNSYANSLVANQTSLEMEKLTLSAFQLMLLRDYYELLERTALTLSVQVSMMADQDTVSYGQGAQAVGKQN